MNDLPEKNQFSAHLRERTMNMAANVRKALLSINVTPVDRHLINQLIRSSSAAAANYRAATRGRSDAEFYSKMCIVVEETDETLYWIDYLIKLDLLNESSVLELRNEVDQLVRLFASIRKTMKEKIERNNEKGVNLKT